MDRIFMYKICLVNKGNDKDTLCSFHSLLNDNINIKIKKNLLYGINMNFMLSST